MTAVVMLPEAGLFRSQPSSLPLAAELEPDGTRVSMCRSNHLQGNELEVKLIATSFPLYPPHHPHHFVISLVSFALWFENRILISAE
jgi:hypothetical protein